MLMSILSPGVASGLVKVGGEGRGAPFEQNFSWKRDHPVQKALPVQYHSWFVNWSDESCGFGGGKKQASSRKCLGEKNLLFARKNHALPEATKNMKTRSSLLVSLMTPVQSLPSQPSPNCCSPSLMGESANAATVGVPLLWKGTFSR